VHAEWGYVGDQEFGVKKFLDLDSLVRTRCGWSLAFHCRRFWELHDFEEQNGVGGTSQKFYKEVNCGKNLWRLISYREYDGNMGLGELIKSEDNVNKWHIAQINETNKRIYEFVCSK
tara:strand:- start:262 stop:612 length:351 start_codon:yes stop_codon:yes gene_type:complete